MSALLLDASVILAAFDSEDEMHDAAKAILADPEVTLATLDLARYEVANVAVRAWRELGQVSPLLEAIDRTSDDGGVTRSVYDAAYLVAASQAGATLVSCARAVSSTRGTRRTTAVGEAFRRANHALMNAPVVRPG